MSEATQEATRAALAAWMACSRAMRATIVLGIRSESGVGAPTASASSNFGHVEFSAISATVGTWTNQADSIDIAKVAPGLFTSEPGISRLDETLQDVWLLIEYTQTVPAWA